MVQCPQKQDSSFSILEGEVTDTYLFRLGTDVSQEGSMRERSVSTEFVKDLRERCLGHGNLQKMIQKWDLFFFPSGY